MPRKSVPVDLRRILTSSSFMFLCHHGKLHKKLTCFCLELEKKADDETVNPPNCDDDMSRSVSYIRFARMFRREGPLSSDMGNLFPGRCDFTFWIATLAGEKKKKQEILASWKLRCKSQDLCSRNHSSWEVERRGWSLFESWAESRSAGDSSENQLVYTGLKTRDLHSQ